MAKIKNMGTATMKFKEGIIVDGNAGNTTDSLIVSGTTVFKDHAQMEVNKRMYFDGSSVANGPYIYGNTTSLFIDGDDRVTLSMDKDLRILDEDNNAIIHITDKDATGNALFRVHDDTNIFFSGSIGSTDGTVFGASTFGGDLVSSGTIYAGKGSGLSEGLIVEGDSILSGNVYINLGGDGESLKIVGALDHDNYIVFEQPAGSNRAYLGLDSGDNLDIVNNSNNDDINFFTTGGGSTKATMIATAGNRVGIGKFGWAGKSEYGHGEAFPRDELDVSGSMRVSENVELMGQSLVVSGTITGRYDDQIPGNAIMFKNTEVYFVTTDDDVNNKVMAPDENIFFTGSIGSMNTTTKGTAVFGGDAAISGSLMVEQFLSFEDYIMAELSISGLDLQTDTNAFRFNCPYNLLVEGLDLYLDQHTTSGNVTVTVSNTTDAITMINLSIPGTDTSASTTSVTSATCDAGDVITFAITATPANAQGLRANMRFRRIF